MNEKNWSYCKQGLTDCLHSASVLCKTDSFQQCQFACGRSKPGREMVWLSTRENDHRSRLPVIRPVTGNDSEGFVTPD